MKNKHILYTGTCYMTTYLLLSRFFPNAFVDPGNFMKLAAESAANRAETAVKKAKKDESADFNDDNGDHM